MQLCNILSKPEYTQVSLPKSPSLCSACLGRFKHLWLPLKRDALRKSVTLPAEDVPELQHALQWDGMLSSCLQQDVSKREAAQTSKQSQLTLLTFSLRPDFDLGRAMTMFDPVR